MFETIAKRDRREWSKVPASFEADAVRAAFADVKALIPRRAISARIAASKCVTFSDLRLVLAEFEHAN